MLAARTDRRQLADRLAADAAVLLRQEIHGEMHAGKLTARDRQVAGVLGASGEHDRLEAGHQFVDRNIHPDMGAVAEDRAFGFHLLDAPVDVVLLHLEVGNAVAQKPARPGVPLEHVHLMTSARELLGAGEPGRAGADHRNLAAGLFGRRFGEDPAFLPGAVDDRAFDRLDGHRVVVEVERARRLAGRWAQPAGEFREIVGRVQIDGGGLPITAIDEIVPVRDLVVHRTAVVTIRYAAIHAARRLVAVGFLRQRNDEFLEMANAIGGRRVAPIATIDFEKAGDLAHPSGSGGRAGRLRGLARLHLVERAAILDRHHLAELRQILAPAREDLTRARRAGVARMVGDELM